MIILLTGHKGFIGKATKAVLERNGHEVLCAERGYAASPRIRDYVKKCDVVLHQGALSDTNEDPNELMFYNYEASRHLFHTAFEENKKVVFASSAAVYGLQGFRPSNVYGWSKICAEGYGSCLFKDRSCSFVALRYFNVYGPGEEHKGKMASVAYQAHEAGFFELFPGEPRRDFVYIEDVASANYHAVTNNISNGAYDVGTSEPRRFEDVCDLMHIKYSYQSKHHIPHGYQTYTCADKKEWMPGWEPTFSLEQGVSCYLNYLGESKT